jgi:hypothetical protein
MVKCLVLEVNFEWGYKGCGPSEVGGQEKLVLGAVNGDSLSVFKLNPAKLLQ